MATVRETKEGPAVKTISLGSRVAGAMTAAGGALVATAALLPWAQHAAPIGSISVSGWDLTWGRVAFALGLAAFVAGAVSTVMASAAVRRGLAVGAIAAGLVAGGIAIYHASATTSDIRTAFERVVLDRRGAVQPGAGGQQRAPGMPYRGPALGPGAGAGRPPAQQRGPAFGHSITARLPSPGAGIWLAIAGGLLAMGGGIAGLGTPSSSPSPASGSSPAGDPADPNEATPPPPSTTGDAAAA